MSVKHICIYHGSCDDGFAAAWVVRKALATIDVEFYQGVYGQDPPDVSGRNVIMVDFSYKRQVLEAMISKADNFLVLDHHKTAQEDLAGLDGCRRGVEIEFDMARSGAMMAWEWFYPHETAPAFIKYIQDRDLWLKKLPDGDEFTIALRSYEQDFAIWDRLVHAGIGPMIAEGRSIQRYYRLRVEELKANAYIAMFGEDEVWVANAPYFAASEVAGELAERGLTFGACYFEAGEGRWQYSLRSRGDFDVSAVAKRFGGGGHKNAAGFTVTDFAHSYKIKG